MREAQHNQNRSLCPEHLGISPSDGLILRNRELMREKFQIDPKIPIICGTPYQAGEHRYFTLVRDTFLVPLLQWNDSSLEKITYGYLRPFVCNSDPIERLHPNMNHDTLNLLAGVKRFSQLDEKSLLHDPTTTIIQCASQEMHILCVENNQTLLLQTSRESLDQSVGWQVYNARWGSPREIHYNSGPLRYRNTLSVDIFNSDGDAIGTLEVTHAAGTFGNGYSAELRISDGDGQRLTCKKWQNRDPNFNPAHFNNQLLTTESFS